MSEAQTVELQLKLLDKYRFEIDFSEFGKIISDEASPLGENAGPNPSRLLAAAVGNCLAASLLFAIRKFKEDPGPVTAKVKATLDRKGKYLRVVHIEVELQLGNHAESIPHLQRALAQFEDFCIVTQSVRKGIAVDVRVIDSQGVLVR
jgi:uncharacterized OsmC-like protein